jgi:hypothetical protein
MKAFHVVMLAITCIVFFGTGILITYYKWWLIVDYRKKIGNFKFFLGLVLLVVLYVVLIYYLSN